MARVRFDYTLLDQEDPFEIDHGNEPHLNKHLLTDRKGRTVAVDIEDLRDAYLDGVPRFYEADEGGDADWLMLAAIPGGLVICVPLAPPNSGEYNRCRPIGLYEAVTAHKNRYLADVGWTI